MENNTIYRSRANLLDMLEYRGYDVSEYRNYTLKDISIMANTHISTKSIEIPELGPLDIEVENDDGNKIFVKYYLSKFKQSPKFDKLIINIFENQELKKNDTLILIVLDTVLFKKSKENRVENYVNKIYTKFKYFVQIYGLDNLLFNISKHEYVPKHRLINKNEIKEMMKKYNIQDENVLPTIKREDPMAKYIGMKPNDICEITAPSIASSIYKKYRKCIMN